jgi:glycosyltransferase involved in cell wall biosynthesis
MSVRNVLFLLWSDKPGGAEIFLPALSERMKDYSFSVFCLRENKDYESSVLSHTPVKVEYASNKNIGLYLELFSFIKKKGNVIVQGFNPGPFVLFTLSLTTNKRILYSIHGSIYWKSFVQKIIRKIFWKFSIRRRMTFTANSEYSRKVFLEKVSGKPDIKVLYNPFDTKRFYKKENITTSYSPVRIFYTGRLAEGKNLLRWIEIASKLLNVLPELEFNIYGDGELKGRMLDLINQKNLSRKIFLHGFRSDIENVYRENDLLLFLSEFESFGNVVVESILCGTPVIASRIPSMEEIFKDYPEFLVNLDEELPDSILKKLEQYSMLKESASKASKEFAERFSFEKHIKELEKIYKSFD